MQELNITTAQNICPMCEEFCTDVNPCEMDRDFVVCSECGHKAPRMEFTNYAYGEVLVENYYPEQGYTIPKSVAKLIEMGILENICWGNDACPFFALDMHDDGARTVVGVDHANDSSREDGGERYNVQQFEADGSGDVIFSCEEETEFMEYVMDHWMTDEQTEAMWNYVTEELNQTKGDK